MSNRVCEIAFEQHHFDAIHVHLLPSPMRAEEAAFLFAQSHSDPGLLRLQITDWIPVPPDGFRSRSLYHLELEDSFRADMIHRAHVLGCSLVEAHSHAGPWPARFSPSDEAGFAEFVPHVLWRLKAKPYAALVFASRGITASAWEPSVRLEVPQLVVGGRSIAAQLSERYADHE